jgi:uncharacterized damage-inducible protein DinB
VSVVDSIRVEYRRYKTLAERAIEQLRDEELSQAGPGGGNSVAVICWHVSGNLRSRFTDLLTTDGEKPWRRRDEEFEPRTVTRAELLAKWESGWQALEQALAGLTDAHLGHTVTIRSQPLTVHEALHRSLAHTSYHVGQIVYLTKAFRGGDWKTLSIPLGASEAVNERMRAQAKQP